MLFNSDLPEIPLFLAPMAGITDLPFRSICKEMGADILITEMISTRGLYYNDEKTFKLLKTGPHEHPIGVQLFGNDPVFFVEAVRKIAGEPFDFININMGCPTPKIVKNGDGCALMKDLELSSRIIQKTAESAGKPVTVKIRKGWDEEHANAVEFSIMAEKSGAAVIIVHGRTREQFYSGRADWNVIREVKKAVNIPVIGNGDVFSPEDAAAILQKTGCDGIMVGRGALGNPWIFREIRHFLRTGENLPPVSLEERFKTMMLHLDRAVAFHGERIGLLEMRKHLAWYLKGLPRSAPVKQIIQQSKDINHIKRTLEDYFSNLNRTI
jgi:tRNA-dihydrouridine synthase B